MVEIQKSEAVYQERLADYFAVIGLSENLQALSSS